MPTASWPKVGDPFDRYVIEAELGSGGMGTVYRAFDSRLQRSIALKVLRENEESVDPAHSELLLREARAAAAFEHPGKVAVFDVGSFEGTTFIAMELVSGQSLRSLVGKREVPLEQRVDWLLEIAAVLAAAHDIGLVHRDIKPENVMVRTDGTTKVLDFGIARRMRGHTTPFGATQAAALPSMTGGDSFVGTPLYMAPEQLRAEPFDGRADQFAWGTLAVELLTGVHPWAAGRTPAQAIASILSSAEPTILPGSMPAELESVLRRALTKDPAQRFVDFRSLQARLHERPTFDSAAALGGGADRTHASHTAEPVAASLPPVGKPKRVGGRWLPIAFVAALVTGSLFWFTRGRGRLPEAGLAALQVYENPKGSDSLSLESAALWQAAEADFARAAAEPGAPLHWTAAQAFTQGQLLLVTDRVDEAVAAFERAARLESEWALPHLALSGAASRKGDLQRALAEAAVAESLAPRSWRAAYAAGAANAYAGQLDQAVEDYRRALAKAPDHPLILSELALVYHAQRLDADAARDCTRALKLDPDMLAPRILLAELALERKDAAEALTQATRALAVFPQSIPAKLAQVEALTLLGRLPEARLALGAAHQLLSKEPNGPYKPRLDAVEARLAEVNGALGTGAPSTNDDSVPSRSQVSEAPRATPMPVVDPPIAPRSQVPKSARPAPRSTSVGKGGADLGF
ncbi:MAG TPA: protein kinase [Polyangiaceae bacterium]|jgi:tetratricopeptide (TPR) repeat protein|nr:protein kinase [Polyangiaceae bacterium]